MRNDAVRISDILRVLANEHRLLVLCELIDGPKSVTALCAKIPDISQSAMSQNLSLMKAHGFLSARKTGLTVTYSIEDRRVEEIIAVLKKNYCQSIEGE